MKKLLANKRGEGYINTAVIIIIAVVIGGLLLGGLYLVFAGDNGVIEQADQKIYDMFNTGGEITLKHEGEKLLYSYDGETWKEATVTGMSETGRVKQYVTMGEGDSTFYLVVIQNETNSVLSYSSDGKEWIPVKTTTSNMTVYKSNTGRSAHLSYSNGMSFTSTDGVNWTMTSTKNY